MEWGEIRALAAEGVSQRAIARRLQVNRRTVARRLQAEAPPPRYTRRPTGSQLDPMMKTISRALERHPDISAPRLTELLRAEHEYRGSVDLVRKRLAALRADWGFAKNAGPRPGGEVQFDWTEMPTRALVGGVRRSVFALVASLPFSGAQTAHFSFDATLESFLEGNVRVFDWLDGVPRDCVYDNLPSFVAKRDNRQALRWSTRFRELRRHYEFRSVLYTTETTARPSKRAVGVASAAEDIADGVPERARPAGEEAAAEKASGPVLQIDSLAEAVHRLKNELWSGCRFGGLGELDGLYATWRDGLGDPGGDAAGGPAMVKRLAQERAALRALPTSYFDFSLSRAVRVPQDGYVRYSACFYRVPVRLVGLRVNIHATRDEVWIVSKGRRVAGYARSYKPGKWLPGPPR